MSLAPQDQELVKAAIDMIKSRYRYKKHAVGSAVRMKSGKVYTGIHLSAYVSTIDICAEPIAIGRAIIDGGHDEIDTIVAVRHPKPDEEDQTIRVVSPCGKCRELISDYGADARVILREKETNDLITIKILDLLPYKYFRE